MFVKFGGKLRKYMKIFETSETETAINQETFSVERFQAYKQVDGKDLFNFTLA